MCLSGTHHSKWHLKCLLDFFGGIFFIQFDSEIQKPKMAFPRREECGFQWDWQIFAFSFTGGQIGVNWKFAGPSQARAWGPGQWTSPKSGTEAFGLRFGGKKFSQAQQKSFFSFFQTQNGPPNPLIQAAIWTLSSQKCHILHENLSFQHLAHFHFLKSGPNHFLRHFLSWKLRTSHGGYNKNWSWPSLA